MISGGIKLKIKLIKVETIQEAIKTLEELK